MPENSRHPPAGLMLSWRVGLWNRSVPRRQHRLKEAFQGRQIRSYATGTGCQEAEQRLVDEEIRLRNQPYVPRTCGTLGPDPFRLRRDEERDPLVRAALQTSIQSGWTTFLPAIGPDGNYAIIRTGLELMSRSDTCFYASLYTSISQHVFQTKGVEGLRTIPPVWFEIQAKALRHLQLDINQMCSQPVSDSTLSVILTLAAHGIDYAALAISISNYPESPLANYQLLRTVGYMKAGPTHFQAMYYLVAKRGGLHEIQDLVIAYIIALTDLIMATVSISSPVFACYWAAPSTVEIRESATDQEFGSAFKNMPRAQVADIAPFVELVPQVEASTAIIDQLALQASQGLPVGEVIAYANYVHYHILAMTPSTDAGRPLLALLRLTARIYSDMVLFPLATTSSVRFRLAAQIYEPMQDPETCHLHDPHLEIWILGMGSTACLPHRLNTSEAIWLLQQLKEKLEVVCGGSRGLTRFLEIMRGFLWWNIVCDAYAEDVWKSLYPPQYPRIWNVGIEMDIVF